MRLIDADKLMGHLMDWALHDNATEIRECMEAVKEQPTVDPVKHGWWNDYPISDLCLQCSCCGVLRLGEPSNYCGNCGAKMDGENDE